MSLKYMDKTLNKYCVVDSDENSISENPIQNKAVYKMIEDVTNAKSEMEIEYGKVSVSLSSNRCKYTDITFTKKFTKKPTVFVFINGASTVNSANRTKVNTLNITIDGFRLGSCAQSSGIVEFIWLAIAQ